MRHPIAALAIMVVSPQRSDGRSLVTAGGAPRVLLVAMLRLWVSRVDEAYAFHASWRAAIAAPELWPARLGAVELAIGWIVLRPSSQQAQG